jgi:hypothetical protein
MTNQYVDFVSDEHFLKCVKEVWGNMNNEKRDDKKLQKNGIDPIKMIFDIQFNKINLKQWRLKESERQNDKAENNAIGNFHQELLGGVKGWTNLKKGHSSGLDLMKDDNTIFIEIKNKDIDLNANVEKNLRRTMFKQHKETPDAKIYFGYVVAKNKKSQEKHWDPEKNSEKWEFHNSEKIRRISGNKLYYLITGKEDALEQLVCALPLAIKNVSGTDHKLNDGDQKEFEKWFKAAF